MLNSQKKLFLWLFILNDIYAIYFYEINEIFNNCLSVINHCDTIKWWILDLNRLQVRLLLNPFPSMIFLTFY